jgi:hypothetical protein
MLILPEADVVLVLNITSWTVAIATVWLALHLCRQIAVARGDFIREDLRYLRFPRDAELGQHDERYDRSTSDFRQGGQEGRPRSQDEKIRNVQSSYQEIT